MNRTRLRAQLQLHEGRRAFVYQDTVGKATIGVGRNLVDRGLSDDEINLLLDNDITAAYNEAVRIIPGFNTLSEDRQHALIDMIFNLGAAGLLKFKKFLAAIEARDFERAATEMMDSKWARQVGQRAETLKAMIWPKSA